jgi:cyclopropane-fatty-acyl-phospholipid synthase
VRAAGLSGAAAARRGAAPQGRRHTKDRDERGVRHHYDVSNDFFATFLDESMTYSCAIFSRGARTLEEAQEASATSSAASWTCGRATACSTWAAGGAPSPSTRPSATARTSPASRCRRPRPRARAPAPRRRASPTSSTSACLDYRDLAGEQFDKVASIGMVEHVGTEQIDRYGEQLAGLLRPGGILLNHGIARLRHSDKPAGAFSERYVFPDGEPLQLSVVLLALERAGLVTRHVEDFQADYAETLRHWAERFDAHLDEATRIAGAERVRVWRLYLRAARNGFLNDFTSIYQVRAHKPAADGRRQTGHGPGSASAVRRRARAPRAARTRSQVKTARASQTSAKPGQAHGRHRLAVDPDPDARSASSGRCTAAPRAWTGAAGWPPPRRA